DQGDYGRNFIASRNILRRVRGKAIELIHTNEGHDQRQQAAQTEEDTGNEGLFAVGQQAGAIYRVWGVRCRPRTGDGIDPHLGCFGVPTADRRKLLAWGGLLYVDWLRRTGRRIAKDRRKYTLTERATDTLPLGRGSKLQQAVAQRTFLRALHR